MCTQHYQTVTRRQHNQNKSCVHSTTKYNMCTQPTESQPHMMSPILQTHVEDTNSSHIQFGCFKYWHIFDNDIIIALTEYHAAKCNLLEKQIAVHTIHISFSRYAEKNYKLMLLQEHPLLEITFEMGREITEIWTCCRFLTRCSCKEI